MQGYIYKVTNKLNNKSYIGLSKDRSIFERWGEHAKLTSSMLSQAIDLYGIENFSFEVLEVHENTTNKDLRKRESELIKKYNTINNGYNKIYSYVQEPIVNTSELNSVARRGLHNLSTMMYYGTNRRHSDSFWERLGHQDLDFIGLLIDFTYFTRKSSMYTKALINAFRVRDQRYFKLVIAGEEFATDNINFILDLIYSRNGFINNSITHFNEYYELNVTYNKNNFKIKLMKPLLFGDELLGLVVIDNNEELMEELL